MTEYETVTISLMSIMLLLIIIAYIIQIIYPASVVLFKIVMVAMLFECALPILSPYNGHRFLVGY